MYRNAYQRGMLTIFFSVGSKPLAIWDTHTQDGYVTSFLDQDIKSMVLEIRGTNVSTTYITCPKGNKVLGITMPFLVMIVKNLKKYFTFEVTVLDETLTRRRFRVSNFQSSTQILPLCTVMPIGLSEGWNQIQFNLADFTRRAYNKQFVEVQKLKINANIRLRRIYFTERLIPDDELPPEYKLFFPLSNKGAKEKKTLPSLVPDRENIKQSTSQQAIEATAPPPVAEKLASKTEIVKPSSRTSIRSIKKSSQESRKGSKVLIDTTPETQAVEPVQSRQEMNVIVETDDTTELEKKDDPQMQLEIQEETIPIPDEVVAVEEPGQTEEISEAVNPTTEQVEDATQ